MSSEIKNTSKWKGDTSILVTNDNSFLSIQSAWTQEPIKCPFWGIIIN